MGKAKSQLLVGNGLHSNHICGQNYVHLKFPGTLCHELLRTRLMPLRAPQMNLGSRPPSPCQCDSRAGSALWLQGYLGLTAVLYSIGYPHTLSVTRSINQRHKYLPTVSQATLFKIKVISDVGIKIKSIIELCLPSHQFPTLPAPIPLCSQRCSGGRTNPKALGQFSGFFPSLSPVLGRQAAQFECMGEPRVVTDTEGKASPSGNGTEEYSVVK